MKLLKQVRIRLQDKYSICVSQLPTQTNAVQCSFGCYLAFHILVESADDERDKLSGPNWLKIENPESRFGQSEIGTWAVSGFTSFPSDGPTFRAATPDQAPYSIATHLHCEVANHSRQAEIKSSVEPQRSGMR